MTRRKPAPADDPGRYLPAIAIGHADRAKRPKGPLSWSDALAAAPWDPSLPAAWEDAFRRAYAGRLVELGVAQRAGRTGVTSGPSGKTKLVQCRLYLSEMEQVTQKAAAAAQNLSWSTWARRKLAAKPCSSG